MPSSLLNDPDDISAGLIFRHFQASICDGRGRILYVNKLFTDSTGYVQEELLGHTYNCFNSGRHPPELFQELWATVRAGRDWRGTLSVRCKDGAIKWLEVVFAPLVSDAFPPGCYITFAVDITRRVSAEEQALQQESALRLARDELELKVARRTEQLAEAKATLEADIRRREASEAELQRNYDKLSELNHQLQTAQEQLLQSEKLASIGHLAAGVAHEINNPIGYVQSNLGTLGNYLKDVFDVLAAYEAGAAALPENHPARIAGERVAQERDLAFVQEDVVNLLAESREGINRVGKIVADLKDFSRVDSSQEWQWASLHRGLDSTLNIVNNEIKYKADVIKEYGELPDIECLASQLNQVFMNLLVNAAQAMGKERGTIILRTGSRDGHVWVEVADNGSGIAPENIKHVFDPFFTTKPVGMGTGLGLSLSYGIIQKHNGRIEVNSEVGKGTSFRITLPIKQGNEGENTA